MASALTPSPTSAKNPEVYLTFLLLFGDQVNISQISFLKNCVDHPIVINMHQHRADVRTSGAPADRVCGTGPRTLGGAVGGAGAFRHLPPILPTSDAPYQAVSL